MCVHVCACVHAKLTKTCKKKTTIYHIKDSFLTCLTVQGGSGLLKETVPPSLRDPG